MNAPSPAATARPHPAALASVLVLLAAALSLGWFWVDGTVGLNLADEGYLWCGVEEVARGRVPMRDFQAYDPGRYLWGAAWQRVLGADLVALRLSCVFFQILGVTAGLLTARRLSQDGLFLFAVGLLLCVWMHPRYKCFEQSIALMAVYGGVLLLERSTLQRHFGLGLFTGLMAVMGRNHGVYCAVASALLIALAAQGRSLRGWLTNPACWAAGVVFGYLPQLLMFRVVPDYWPAFQQYLAGIFTKGNNLPTRVPWPWLVDMTLPNWSWLAALLTGVCFLVLPGFLALALVRVLQMKGEQLQDRRVLVAATCVTLPYAHFAFSRPDLVHLGHAMPTLLLGLIAAACTAPAPWLGKLAAPALLAVSTLTNLFQIGFVQQLLPPPGGLQPRDVRGRTMLVGAPEAALLASGLKVVRELAGLDEHVLFLPNLPGLYPATEHRPPIRQLYAIFPTELREEARMIREVEDAPVQWVLLRDYPTDGRDDLRFRNTNPLLFAHLSRYFTPFPTGGLPAGVVLLHRTARQSP